ncbi:MAG: OmpA family protein [Deltaproteobacteria bacterium]
MRLRTPLFFVAAATLFATEANAGPPVHLATVRFQAGGARLVDGDRDALKRIAKKLADGAVDRIRIVGHTDTTGSAKRNERLGLRRARTVATRLTELGVDARSMDVTSVGEREPLTRRRNRAAHARNRRVEVWVATGEVQTSPPAWVSWVHREVQAREPSGVDWRAAALNMPLDEMFRVRTLPESAGEVTFRTMDRLRLGEESLVVIYRGRAASDVERHRLEDVVLEEGTLLAALANEDHPVAIRSPAATIDVASKSTRIGYDALKKSNTVSVYRGKSRVSARGKSVDVNRGFGTRVKVGEAPEEPTRLPDAPKWAKSGAIVTLTPSQEELRWELVGTATVAVLEVRDARPDADGRVLRTLTATDHTRLFALADGAYEVVLRGRDSRGLVGEASVGRPLIVLEAVATSSAAPTVTDGVIELDAPQEIALALPSGVRLTSATGTVTDGVWRVPVDAGRHTIDYQLEARDAAWSTSERLVVNAQALPVEPAAPPPPPQAAPIVVRAEPSPPRRAPRFGLGLRLGVALPVDGDAQPVVSADYGARIPIVGLLNADFGAEVGWSRHRDGSGTSAWRQVDLVPIRLRGALVLEPGAWRWTLGGAGGLQVVMPKAGRGREPDLDPTQPSWRALLGVGRAFEDRGELSLEASYTRLRLTGSELITDHRFMGTLTFRVIDRSNDVDR